MENLAFVGTIITIHILAWLTPGPLFVLIVRNSLIYSRKIGFWTSLGFSLGNLIHITLAVFGISIIIQSSPLAFNVIKFLGAGYLIYLGIKTFLLKIEAQKADHPTEHKDISNLQAVKIGFLANISSTGAYLFFASIFSTVLSSSSPFWVILFLAITMPLNTFVMSSILTIFFTQKNVKIIYGKFQHIINQCLGVALILLALLSLLKK